MIVEERNELVLFVRLERPLAGSAAFIELALPGQGLPE